MYYNNWREFKDCVQIMETSNNNENGNKIQNIQKNSIDDNSEYGKSCFGTFIRKHLLLVTTLIGVTVGLIAGL